MLESPTPNLYRRQLMPLAPDEIREKVRKFIVKELIRDVSYQLGDNEEIITKGLMDSFSLAELGVFVEQEFGVYIPDPDLTVDRMNTLNQIVARILQE
jgi:acyl carrier protein